MKTESASARHRINGSTLLVTMILMEACLVASAVVPFTLAGPGVNPTDFEVTEFASGLDYPNGMAELADGSILVAVGDGSPEYFSGAGRIVLLEDANGDGVADGSPVVLASGLSPPLTALGQQDTLVFAMGAAAPIYIFRTGTSPADPLTLIGQIDFDYSASREYHGNSALLVRKAPGVDNRYDLFFQIGGEENFAAPVDTIPISSSNVLNTAGTLTRAAAHMMTLQDHGTHMEMISVVQIATGLRNAAGFAIHPTRGDLYFNDNGIDGLVDSNEPHSADELNVIQRLVLGTAIQDFGFPGNYTAYRTGTVVGGGGIQPLIAFQPYTDPITGLRSEGPNGLVFSPPGFPEGLNTGVFIGFHGKFVLGGLDNDENPVVYANSDTGEYFHFIHGQQAGIGHLDGLLATRDSLYVADLATGGSLFDNAGQGVIYKIRSLAPVAPDITVAHDQDSLILEWDRGTLYHSTDPSNDWQMLDEAFSPFEIPASPLPRFFRSEY